MKNIKTFKIVSVVIAFLLIICGMIALFSNNNQTIEVEAKGTAILDQITIANMYANKDTGTYGNFRWDPSILSSISETEFTFNYWTHSTRKFYIVWQKPSNMSYPTKLKYGYDVPDGTNKDSASKTYNNDETANPSLPQGGDGRKQYAVSTSTLYSNYDKIVFWMGYAYTTGDLTVKSLTFQLQIDTVNMQASAGTGVKEVFVSSNGNATSGSASGTFNKGTTVYAFAKLNKGYNAANGWTLVSGTANSEDAIYRAKSSTAGTSDYNFGSISATAKTVNVSRNNNYDGASTYSFTITYGESILIGNPTRKGFEFLGWNSNPEGTGTNYGDTFTAEQVNDIVMGTVSVPMVYAQWNQVGTIITLDRQNGTGGSDSVIATNGEAMPEIQLPSRAGYTFNGYFGAENGTGTNYYNADGTSATNWDSDELEATLYASWTIKPEVQNAIDKINAIGEVTYPESNDAINAARTACDAVGADDKVAVTNYYTLIDAEERYQELKEAKEAADPVNELIDAIGEVTYPGSNGAINAARTAYNNLTTDDQRSFANYLTLETAENTYATLRTNAIDNVNSLIDAIGEVTYPGSNDSINAARTAFNSIGDDDKDSVTNYSTLETAESRYQELKEAKEAADSVNELIDAIGEVTYPGSNDSINAARTAYNNLTTDDQRSFVNYSILETAENTYATLRTNAIDNVNSLIDAIGEVTYPGSNDAIKDARAAFNALSNDAKAHVDNLSVLENDETEFETLKTNAINAVIDFINAIGEVTYPDSKDIIDVARSAFDALREEDKSSVSNSQTLTESETEYDRLKENGANEVKTLINNIGKIAYSKDSKDKMDSARSAYNSLTAEQKELVTNYSALTHGEEVYNNIKKVIEKIENVGDVNLDSGEKVNTAKEAYEGLTEEEKEIITEYHETLVVKEQTYTKVVHDHKVAVICGIVFGILGGLIVLACIAYVLMMFVFNKWIKKGEKAVRVFKLGKKDGKVRLLVMPCKFEYHEESEVADKKENL